MWILGLRDFRGFRVQLESTFTKVDSSLCAFFLLGILRLRLDRHAVLTQADDKDLSLRASITSVAMQCKRSDVSLENNKRDECNSNNAKPNIKTTTEREKCIAYHDLACYFVLAIPAALPTLTQARDHCFYHHLSRLLPQSSFSLKVSFIRLFKSW